VPGWGPFLEIAHPERDAQFEGHVEPAEVLGAWPWYLERSWMEYFDSISPLATANDTRIGLAFSLMRAARREALGGNRQHDGVKEGLEVVVERAVDETRFLVCRRHGIT